MDGWMEGGRDGWTDGQTKGEERKEERKKENILGCDSGSLRCLDAHAEHGRRIAGPSRSSWPAIQEARHHLAEYSSAGDLQFCSARPSTSVRFVYLSEPRWNGLGSHHRLDHVPRCASASRLPWRPGKRRLEAVEVREALLHSAAKDASWVSKRMTAFSTRSSSSPCRRARRAGGFRLCPRKKSSMHWLCHIHFGKPILRNGWCVYGG